VRAVISLIVAAALTGCGVPGYSASEYAELVDHCKDVVANPTGCEEVVELVEEWRCPVREAYGIIDILSQGRIPSESERSGCPAATPPTSSFFGS
jgi:hypothetical protein